MRAREWMNLYDKLYHHKKCSEQWNTNFLQRKPQASGSHTESFLMRCVGVVVLDLILKVL